MKIYQLNLSNGYEQFVEESDAVARQQQVGGTIEVIDVPDPDAINLDLLKTNAIQSVRLTAKDRQDQEVQTYAAAEIATWTAKEMEAKTFQQTNDEADAPILSAEASAQGASLEAICQIILENSDRWRQMQTAIVAWRGNTIAAINNAQTLADLEAVSLVMQF